MTVSSKMTDRSEQKQMRIQRMKNALESRKKVEVGAFVSKPPPQKPTAPSLHRVLEEIPQRSGAKPERNDVLARIYKDAVKNNKCDVLDFLEASQFMPDVKSMTLLAYEAASAGSLDAIKWLKKRGALIPSVELYILAAAEERVEICAWCCSEGLKGVVEEGFDYCA